MDVEALMDRAMGLWKEMGDSAEEDVASVESPADESVEAAVSVPEVEQDDVPEATPEDPLDQIENEQTVDAELETETVETATEDDIGDPVDPTEIPDEMPGEQEVSDHTDEPLTEDAQEAFPDDPLDSIEELRFQPDEPLGVEQDAQAQDEELATETFGQQREETLAVGGETEEQSTPGFARASSRQETERDWMTDISDMIQPQFHELRSVLANHLNEAMDRNTLITDAMGIEGW